MANKADYEETPETGANIASHGLSNWLMRVTKDPLGLVADYSVLLSELQTALVSNAAVIGKVLTGYVSGAGTVAATDTILQAIQKLNGNIAAMPKPFVPSTTWDASSGTFPSGDTKGYAHKVTVGGTVDGVTFTINDLLVAEIDNPSTTVFAGNWQKWDVQDQIFLNVAQTWTALQTYVSSMFAIKGSSTGVTKIASANASATDYTATLQAATGTIAYLTDITAGVGGYSVYNIYPLTVTDISSQSVTGETVTNITGMTKTIAADANRPANTIFHIQANWVGFLSGSVENAEFGLALDGTAIGAAAQVGSRNFGFTPAQMGYFASLTSGLMSASINYMHTLTDATELIFTMTVRLRDTNTVYNNRSSADANDNQHERGTSTFNIIEYRPVS
jgi:hypothetical protein